MKTRRAQGAASTEVERRRWELSSRQRIRCCEEAGIMDSRDYHATTEVAFGAVGGGGRTRDKKEGWSRWTVAERQSRGLPLGRTVKWQLC